MSRPGRPRAPIPLRLRWHRRVDRAACWLIARGQHRAAVALWRTFRMI